MGCTMFSRKEEQIKKEDLIPRKDYDKLNDLVKVHQDYLNNIFVFYKLKPTPYLQSLRDLSYEFLRLFDNICKKYDLDYWMAYGSLLGTVRHNDFVPWDDDLDVGMMRKDYMKLIEVIESEIEANNLENFKCAYKIDKHDKVSKRWFQISYYLPDYNRKVIGIDIFPHDFIDGEASDDFEDRYYDSRAKFYDRRKKSDDMDKITQQLYDELNLSMEPQEYFTHGVESVHGKVNMFKFQIIETKELFPLQRAEFGKIEVPIPNNPPFFLKSTYGNKFMRIPKKIRAHGRLAYFHEIEGIIERFNGLSEDIRKVNDSYGF